MTDKLMRPKVVGSQSFIILSIVFTKQYGCCSLVPQFQVQNSYGCDCS